MTISSKEKQWAQSDSREDNAIQLVINVDDLGISQDTADGALQLWEARAISSVSVLAFGSDVDHTVKLLIENNIPTGVHLALNHGRGVLPANEVPSLHASNGDFWNSAEETLARLVMSDVKREFEAQIERLLRVGIAIRHLDSHMGLAFMSPELLMLYQELAQRYRLAVALPEDPYFDPVRKQLAQNSLAASISLNGIYELSGGAEETLTNRAAHYRSLLRSLKPGLNYIFSHPSPPTARIKAEFGDHTIRNHDFELFISSEWKEMIAEAKITIASFPSR
ncbi:MAG TPA: ChbG/HpnK family deacetylase [Syntrophorhabdaceae bacterium]|nr:ChbG/HpnK family deacetylase [Syntrophorhabdaceae bacterium]